MAAIIPGTDSTWIYYIDESHDDEKFCLVALGFRIGAWREAIEKVKAFRRDLRKSDGVGTHREIHARDLVSGRGTLAVDKKGQRIPISNRRRVEIYTDLLRLTSELPSIHVFNVCLDCKGRRDAELDAWDRLLNRLQRTAVARNRSEHRVRGSILGMLKKVVPEKVYDKIALRAAPYTAHVIIIADEGRQREIAKMRRKMGVVNYIPSQHGGWGGGASTKNIPLENFVEDALFRDSAQSYFIQLADCAAFALLKRETSPTPRVKKHGLQKLWDLHLRSVAFKNAAPKDPDGIVRR
jgi:hypothetical protein